MLTPFSGPRPPPPYLGTTSPLRKAPYFFRPNDQIPPKRSGISFPCSLFISTKGASNPAWPAVVRCLVLRPASPAPSSIRPSPFCHSVTNGLRRGSQARQTPIYSRLLQPSEVHPPSFLRHNGGRHEAQTSFCRQSNSLFLWRPLLRKAIMKRRESGDREHGN